MKRFDAVLTKYNSFITENEEIQTDMDAGEETALPGMGGGELAGGEPDGGSNDMDNKDKIDTDPNSYIESLLEMMSKVPVETFNQYIDNFSNDLTSVDKDSMKKYYNTFFVEAERFLGVKEQFKNLFGKLNDSANNLSNNVSMEPDAGHGGVDGSGPSGPGV